MVTSPQPAGASEPPGPRLFSTVTKVGGAIAAFTGGVVGLVAFFNLDSLVVFYSLDVAILLVIAYYALNANRRWIRILAWTSFSFLLIIGLAVFILANFVL